MSAGDSAALDLTTASRKRLKSINVWRQREKEDRRKILFVPWLDSDQMQSDLKKKLRADLENLIMSSGGKDVIND